MYKQFEPNHIFIYNTHVVPMYITDDEFEIELTDTPGTIGCMKSRYKWLPLNAITRIIWRIPE